MVFRISFKDMVFNDKDNQWKKLSLSFSNDIEIIFADLFKIVGIHGISFHRIYKNETRIFLSNSSNWIENYFENNYFLAQTYKEQHNMLPYTLWAQWPKNDKQSQKIIKDAYNNFNSGNSLSICRAKEEYIDIFSLRGYARDHEINNRYFMYLDLINAHIDHFLILYKDYIAKALDNKIILNIKTIDKLTVENATTSNTLKNNINLTNIVLHPDTDKPFLGKREMECLKGLIRGKTIKEIATMLRISSRTAEHHLNNIKHKLNVYSKSALLEKILSLDNNKKILLN